MTNGARGVIMEWLKVYISLRARMYRGIKSEGEIVYKHFFKRFFDIIGSVLAIVILALPMLIIAIVVKCDSKGPAIFVQERMGRKDKPFRFYKFRSMTIDAPKNVATKDIHSDCYITKVGAFLRKTSLDELPQLFCILKGDMSFVGPRPVVLTETELIDYRKEAKANLVRPGLTGLAQVNGRDCVVDMRLKAELDGQYASKITLWGDIKILFKTVGVVLKSEGIVEGDSVLEQEPATDSVATQALAEVATSEDSASQGTAKKSAV